MSRGLGPVQWRALEVLKETKSEGLPVRKLKARMGTERSNARRAIRGLLKRDLVEEIEHEGERRLRLTFWGILRVIYQPSTNKERTSPLAEALRNRREQRKVLAEERALRQAEAAKGPLWFRYKHRPARRRQAGPVQKLILAILWEYAESLEEGLEIPAVKAIVSGDRANTRRAIRTLLLRGDIEESQDGRRIRLTDGTALLFSIIPPILLESIDEARAILQAHQGS